MSLRKPFPWNVIAFWLYMLSIALPAVITPSFQLFGRGQAEYIFGIHCIVLGWVTLPWYANLVLLTGVIAKHYEHPGFAMVCADLALGVACTSWFYDDVTMFVGGYVWLGALAAFVVGTTVAFLTPPRPR